MAPMNERSIVQSLGSMLGLRAHKNSPPFIFHLPIGIFEIIFIQYAHHCYRDGCPAKIVPSWVNVSYVCRHWRNVALSCATLWAYVFATSPRWTKELLIRSKQAPLKVYMNLSLNEAFSQTGWPIIEELMDHVERIQELRLNLPITGINLVLSKLCLRAPRLQTLKTLACSAFPSFPMPPFCGDTPALRELQLVNYTTLLRSFKLSGLTSLSLQGNSPQFHHDTEEFLAMLCSMQDLQYLYLSRVLPSAAGFLSSAAFRAFKQIDLPRLTRFSIASPPSAIIALLSCINFPSKTELRLESCFERDFDTLDDYFPFFLFLSQRFGNCDTTPSIPTIRSLVINFSDSGKATLTFSSCERDGGSGSMSDEWDCNTIPKISFHYSFQESLRYMEHLTSNVCCSVPLTHVKTAHVIDPPLTLEFWSKVLGSLRSLRYLKLSAGEMPDLASVLSLGSLSTNMENEGEFGSDQVLLPALEELELDWVMFSPPLTALDRGIIDQVGKGTIEDTYGF